MDRRYTYACTLSWGGDEPTAEVEVEVSYTVAWGSDPSPATNDPGSPTAVEDITLDLVEGKPRPWGMYYGYIPKEDDEFATVCVEMIEGSNSHLETMISEAAEREGSDREAAAAMRGTV